MEIIPEYFIYSIFITVIILYTIYPNPKIILLKPSVNDEKSVTYKDENDVCYRYHRKEIPCDK